ncbi:hypothetical protein [Noviherbaspirillum sp.]|uniref:hypothetical protein n=1 Tax=Noviherbaspirillum sp. TaxID=1926288 RepID=UPI0025D6F382|nr:hypothetical protein [Noviherbaspirillum sp.]
MSSEFMIASCGVEGGAPAPAEEAIRNANRKIVGRVYMVDPREWIGQAAKEDRHETRIYLSISLLAGIIGTANKHACAKALPLAKCFGPT